MGNICALSKQNNWMDLMKHILIAVITIIGVITGQNIYAETTKVELKAVQTAPDSIISLGQQKNPMLHQEGNRIVNGAGQPVQLRGTLIEGWLMWNGTLWGAGLTSETQIFKKIVELVGAEKAQRFRQAVYDNFFSEADVKLMAEVGFNVVRIPFNHTILEDDAQPYVYKDAGWRILDRTLEWCEKYGVYAVLDLHSAPGGQSGIFVSDFDAVKLWDLEENKKRTLALWKAIASRYKDKQIVAAYDLLNEPDPHDKDYLVDFYKQLTAAVREVDPFHMVIFQGTNFSTNFSMYEKSAAQPVSNMMYSFHSYNFFGSALPDDQVRDMAILSRKHTTPIWNSEFGANTTEWVRGTVHLFEAPENGVSGWIYWPWKRVGEQDNKRWAALMEIPHTPAWDKTRGWMISLFGLFAPKPSPEEALQAMCEFIEMSRAHNLLMNSDMAQALSITPRRADKPADTLAQVQAMCASPDLF